MRNPMYQIILETAKGDASVQSIIEDRGMPETWALDMAEQWSLTSCGELPFFFQPVEGGTNS